MGSNPTPRTIKDVSLGGVVYYRVSDVENLVKPPQYVDLNPTEYFILKIVASGRITARDIHKTYIFMRPISRVTAQ